MSTCRFHTTVPQSPVRVLNQLTDPTAIAAWAPIPFELVELDGARLDAGTHARVQGQLLGRRMTFDIEVLEASRERFALLATGPISIDVEYLLEPVDGGTDIRTAVGVDGGGLRGALLARATRTLLNAGVLTASLNRLSRNLPNTREAPVPYLGDAVKVGGDA